MAAKMGGFRSPNGVRKPELKGAGMVGAKGSAMASPMGGAMGMPGMKKGGLASKKGKRGKK